MQAAWFMTIALVGVAVFAPIAAAVPPPTTSPATRLSNERMARLVSDLSDPNLQHDLMSRRMMQTPATEAASELWKIGPAAVPALTEALNDPDETTRANVAFILARFRTAESGAALRLALKDQAAEVRAIACGGLMSFNDPETVASLMPALNDIDAGVRRTAAHALSRAAAQTKPGHPISNYLQADVVKALVERLADQDEDVQQAATDALGKLKNSNAIAGLIAFLKSNPRLRKNALRSLGEIGDREATVAILDVIVGADRLTIAEGARALGKLADVRATLPLIVELDHTDEQVRVNVAEALGLIGDRRAAPGLIEALSDEREHVRRTAAEALGRLHDPSAVEPLIVRLQDEPRVVAAAAWSLGELADPRAIRPLVDTMFARRGRHVAESLEKIRHTDVIRVLVERSLTPGRDNDAAFEARRTIGRLVGRDFSYDQDGLKRWWRENEQYCQPHATR